MPPFTQPKPENETGLALGLSLIGILVALLIAALAFGVRPGPIQAGPSSILLGLYIMVWGVMFLASYYFSHKSFFFRALIWVCEKASHPRSRKMAFFYFALAIIVGGASLLAGMGVL